MALGLTFTHGRTNGTTIESASIARVAGQFTAPYLSCPVRASGSHRVQLTIPPSGPTPTTGAVLIYCDPDNNHNAAGLDNPALLFTWRTDDNNRIIVLYDKASARFDARRESGGAGAAVTVASTFNAGDAKAVYCAWTATTLYLAVDGGAIASVGNTSIPALPATADVGSITGIADYFDAAYGAVALFSAPLSTAQWQALAGLRSSRPPLMCEQSGTLMRLLWYGAHSRVWTLASGGVCYDFANGSGANLERIINAGAAPVLNRAVETPTGDGATYIDTRLAARQLAITLRLIGSSLDNWWGTVRREIIGGMGIRREGAGVIMFAPASLIYEIDALFDGGLGMEDYEYALSGEVGPVFVCHDPAWRAAALNEAALSIAAGGWSISWTIPWTITVTEASTAVTLSGDLDSYPIVTFTAGAGGCRGPRIANTTTGEEFSLGGLEMAAGEVLTIDMAARTAVVGSTNVLGYRTAGSKAWALAPGANTVVASLEAGSATVTVQHATRFAGV